MRRGARAIALALGAMLVLAGPAQAAQNLLDTYEQALRNDPDLLGAEAEAGAAGARYRRARGQLLPQLSAHR